MPSAYHVKRNKILGKTFVHFECDLCKAAVHCPLTDAGTIQKCPECGGSFGVPGDAELEAEKALIRLKRDADVQAIEQRVAQRRVQAAATASALLQESMANHSPRQRLPLTPILEWMITPSLKWLSISLITVGMINLGLGFIMDTSAASEIGRVNNLGLLNTRLCRIVFGAVFSSAGFLVWAMAQVGEEIKRSGNELREQIAKLRNDAQSD